MLLQLYGLFFFCFTESVRILKELRSEMPSPVSSNLDKIGGEESTVTQPLTYSRPSQQYSTEMPNTTTKKTPKATLTEEWTDKPTVTRTPTDTHIGDSKSFLLKQNSFHLQLLSVKSMFKDIIKIKKARLFFG